MHPLSCELFGMQGGGAQALHIIKSDWPICVSSQDGALDLRALTGLEAGWGRFVQGPHGDSESMETPRNKVREALGLGLGLPPVERGRGLLVVSIRFRIDK